MFHCCSSLSLDKSTQLHLTPLQNLKHYKYVHVDKNKTKWPEKFQTAAPLNGTNISAEFRKLISVLDSLDNPVAPASCSESVQGFSIDY